MIPTTFEYARATSLDDALAKLKAAGSGGKFIAGGHSLVPLMKLRLSEPQVLIDISRLPELAGIREREGKIVIGAGTVHHDVATSALLRERCPVVAEAAAEIGDPQVRHRGTLGGSVAHADPSADMPAVLLALDAEIHLKGPKGWRMVKAPTSSKVCSPWTWRQTRSSPASSSSRCGPPPMPSCTNGRRTTPSSASPRHSR